MAGERLGDWEATAEASEDPCRCTFVAGSGALAHIWLGIRLGALGRQR